MIDKDFFELLKNNELFAGLSDAQINQVAPFVRTAGVKTGEFIINNNEDITDIYVITEGEAEVLKKESGSNKQHRIAVLPKGEIIGELSLLDNAPRSSAVRATQPTTLLIIAIKDLQALANTETIYKDIIANMEQLLIKLRTAITEEPVYNKIFNNIARKVSQRLRSTGESVTDALRKQLHHETMRVAMGYLLVNLIALIAFYSIGLGVIRKLSAEAGSTTFVGIPILLLFFAGMYYIIKKNPYPLSFYGLTLDNWKRATLESLLFTFPILLLIVLIKYLVITFTPAFENQHLFAMSFAHTLPSVDPNAHMTMRMAGIIYILLVPLQELMFRGFLQGSLQEFLSGPNRLWTAIFISNLVFSLTHLHVSLLLSLMVFIPGLFWGWMYARQRTLIGVCLSHLLVGVWTFFVVGIDFFLRAMA